VNHPKVRPLKVPERAGLIRRVALTGSIATGKSAAARMLADLGVPVVDADELARRVVEPGRPAWEEIRRTFGPSVVRADGEIDRNALAAVVFSDPEALKRLNAIVHPRVAEEAEREFSRCLGAEPACFVVYNVPLLFEAGLSEGFDLVAVVYAGPALQRERLRRRNGFSQEEIDRRIAAQLDMEEKVRRADVVLDNRGTLEELERQVRDLVAAVRAHNAGKAKKD
jgi:dephospho-CoA kinase